MRRPGPIYVTVDNCPGFQNLINKKHDDLANLKIKFIKTDEINKNANAIVDRGCRELEDELKRLEPEGDQITTSILKLAILNLNAKLRRKGCISAYEINTSRDQYTGENLKLNDGILRQNQLLTRKQIINASENNVYVGDTVRIKNKNDKHKANEAFLVTERDGDHIEMQKIAHPIANKPTKLMGKIYRTK